METPTDPKATCQHEKTTQEAEMSTSNMGCGRCTKPTTKTCGGCKNIRYCSKECQLTDRRNHKTLCSTFKDFVTPPSPLHRRGIIFRPDAAKPEFVWFQVAIKEKEDHFGDLTAADIKTSTRCGIPEIDPKGDTEVAELDDLLGKGMPDTMGLVQGTWGNGQMLDHTIHIWCRDAFLKDGSAVNTCLSRFTGGETGVKWRGPILFAGQSKVVYSNVFRDLDTADLTVLLTAMEQSARERRLGLRGPRYYEDRSDQLGDLSRFSRVIYAGGGFL